MTIWRRWRALLYRSRSDARRVLRADFIHPLIRFSGIQGLFVWVRDVDIVEKVMTDKTTFPTRGDTGFSTWVPEGLLALPTGPKWQLHRRLVSRFLSTECLRNYGVGTNKNYFPSHFFSPASCRRLLSKRQESFWHSGVLQPTLESPKMSKASCLGQPWT